jgi:nucleoside 2-deoxyribosyltransferase
MRTCFVIQPFDRGPFDQRFDDVIAPAIEAAGLRAYRVDRDPSASVPIEEIERQIRASAACLADISQSNPNVWFELGYAIAAGKPVVLLRQEDAVERLPFDIQHRNVTFYRTGSPSDFRKMGAMITERLRAELEKADEQASLLGAAVVANQAGLTTYETTAIATIGELTHSPTGSVTASSIREVMSKQGYTKLAFTTAIAGLMRKNLVLESWDDSHDERGATYYGLSEAGIDWLLANQDRLRLMKDEPAPDEDVPF